MMDYSKKICPFLRDAAMSSGSGYFDSIAKNSQGHFSCIGHECMAFFEDSRLGPGYGCKRLNGTK